MNYSEMIAEAMRLGMTQREIAEKCGCSQQTISCLLLNPERDTSAKLAASLRKLYGSVKRRKADEHKYGLGYMQGRGAA